MQRRRTVGLPVVCALLAVSFNGSVVRGGQPPPGQTPAGPASRTSARVHHLHFLANDPIAAMQASADRFGGIVVSLPGVGAGVRIGNHYLLFSRGRNSSSGLVASDRIQSIFDASVRWLSDHGVSVAPAGLATLAAAAPSVALPLDHLGFASSSYADTVNEIVARGAQPLSHTNDAAMFALADGTEVEVVREADAPDAYWCPMHPGVRSGATGKCPLCSMDLVAIVPSRIGEYRMQVAVVPGAQGRGLGGLRLVFTDPANGRAVSDLLTVHEKPLHLFIVSRDLEYFAHVHPDARGHGRFVLKHEAPPGEYVVIADFLPRNGTAQMVHRAIMTPGVNRPAAEAPRMPRPEIPDAAAAAAGNRTWGSAEKIVDGVRVRLDAADLIAGRIGLLRFHLFRAADGTPIADLEPFLGAPGHMLMATSTLTDAVHGHPEETGTDTPFITFKPMMPPPGPAKLWLQFQRGGKITTVSFVIDVLEP
jgi:hypothetical protein